MAEVTKERLMSALHNAVMICLDPHHSKETLESVLYNYQQTALNFYDKMLNGTV